MSALQKFLRDGGKIEDLLSRFAIKATRHREHSNLVLFKYNQIDSPFAEPIVRESRGIILDEADAWRVVSRSFNKFFNHGEGHAAPIDWATARVQEKIDGSLCVLYHYADKWHVQTSGMPDAVGEVNGCGFSFADLFWRTFKAQGLTLPRREHADMCFAFELTSPWNRVVVPHKEERVTLLAVRNRETGREMLVEEWAREFPVVASYPLDSFDGIISSFEHIDPLSQEGYVVVDADGNRVKVKHPGYVAIHHLRDGFGPKRLLQVIRVGEAPELLTYYPEWTEHFNAIQAKYDALVTEVEVDFARLKHIEVQKDFALEAVKTRCSGALFQMRKGQVASAKEFFAKMVINNLMDMLRLKDTVEEIA